MFWVQYGTKSTINGVEAISDEMKTDCLIIFFAYEDKINTGITNEYRPI